MTKLEILKAARALINEPWKWTRKAFARNVSGEAVKAGDPSATCFCMVGALARAGGVGVLGDVVNVTDDDQPYREAVFLIRASLGGKETDGFSIAMWQDHPGTLHTDVLRVFDVAIATAELEEAANGPEVKP